MVKTVKFWVFCCFFRKYKKNQKKIQTKTKDIYKTNIFCYNNFFPNPKRNILNWRLLKILQYLAIKMTSGSFD